MKALYKLYLSVLQRVLPQKLDRMPEMDLVMLDREQDEEYNRDGEEGVLASVYEIVANAISRIAPATGEALDICCGSAQLLCKVAKVNRGLHFTGLDYSNHMLQFARENKIRYAVPHVDFQRGDMYHLDQIWKPRHFDLITWHFAMHHCETEDQVVAVFNQIAALVKEKGSVFVFDIRRPKTGKIALEYAEVYNNMWGDWFYQDSLDSYKAAFTFEEVERLLSQSDLKKYHHVEPVIGNMFQAIWISSSRKPPINSISNLKHNWQKEDYQFLKVVFGDKI